MDRIQIAAIALAVLLVVVPYFFRKSEPPVPRPGQQPAVERADQPAAPPPAAEVGQAAPAPAPTPAEPEPRGELVTLENDALRVRVSTLEQRVAIAALLAQEPQWVLLDEPASYLDPAQQMELYRLIGQLWREGMGILCVTHDVNILSHAVRPSEAGSLQVMGLEAGKLRFTTSYDAPELGERLGALFRVEIQSLQLGGRRFFASAPLAASQP